MSISRLGAAIIAGGAALSLAPLAHASLVRTGRAACAMAKVRVAASLRRRLSRIPYCEALRATDSPRGFYLVRLSGRCREEICGSTLIGWYAVQKRTGRVFAWDVGEWWVGAPIS